MLKNLFFVKIMAHSKKNYLFQNRQFSRYEINLTKQKSLLQLNAILMVEIVVLLWSTQMFAMNVNVTTHQSKVTRKGPSINDVSLRGRGVKNFGVKY